MKDQGRHIELLEIFRKIGLRKSLDAIEDGLMSSKHSLQPERIPQSLRNLGIRPVGAIERRAKIFEKLRTVGQHGSPELVERLKRQAAWICGRLQHQRWYRADEHGLRNALCSVAADVAGDFPPPVE